MSTVNNGPQIVRSALILDLDASYMRSYSPNVMPNPTDIFAWCGAASTNSCTLSRDATITRQYGSIPLKMTVTGSDSYFQSYSSSIWNLAPALNGQTWTISVYAKASVASTFGQIFLFPANASGNTLATFGTTSFTITSSWQRFSFTYTITGEATTAFIQMRLDGSNTAGEIIWWDGLQVERASSATPFNPYYIGNTVWKDVSSNNYSGTLTNGPLFSNTNKGTISFDGVDDYIALPTSGLAFGTGTFTIEAWVNLSSSTTTNVIYYSQSSNASGFVGLLYSSGNGFQLTDFDGSTRITTTNTASLSLGSWYHVVGVRSVANRYIVYVNSVASTTNSVSGLSLTTADPRIGINPVSGAERWNGRMAGFKIYNRVLTQAEISQNYETTKTRFGL